MKDERTVVVLFDFVEGSYWAVPGVKFVFSEMDTVSTRLVESRVLIVIWAMSRDRDKSTFSQFKVLGVG